MVEVIKTSDEGKENLDSGSLDSNQQSIKAGQAEVRKDLHKQVEGSPVKMNGLEVGNVQDTHRRGAPYEATYRNVRSGLRESIGFFPTKEMAEKALRLRRVGL